MKLSRNTQHHRHTLINMQPPRNNLASLKAIMSTTHLISDQGRVPLGQYINQRPNKNTPSQLQQMSYIE